MKEKLRKEAIRLRKRGCSYNMIVDRLGVSKSTLSMWLRDIPFLPNTTVKRRINESLLKTIMSRHKIKRKSLADAQKFARSEVKKMSHRDLMMLGIGLYIGEGAKCIELTHVANSDPAVLKLSILWLKKCFNVPLKNFRINLHLYPDNNEREAKKFWSKNLQVPIKQFDKTQVDRRTNKSPSNKRKLAYGTAHLKIRACGNSDFGVQLHRRIMAMISEIEFIKRV